MKRPDDLELFVEGIVIYHMVTEGVLAMTGQRVILQYMSDHSIYPGFQQGVLAGRAGRAPPHRLRGPLPARRRRRAAGDARGDPAAPSPACCREAAKVFIPYYEDPDATEFVSYDNHSSQVYGFAYTALKRRMDVIGVEIPPPEELMPGPIDPRGLEGGPIAQPVDIEPVVIGGTQAAPAA